MLETPQDDEFKDGTSEQPLILTSDTSYGWACLLEAIYDRLACCGGTATTAHLASASHSLSESRAPSGEVLLCILPIAHKYCMELIEDSILDRLKQASTTATFVDLMVGSQMVDSEELYELAMNGLKASYPKPDLVQAKRIGVVAYHEVTSAALTSANSLLRTVASERDSSITSLQVVREALEMSTRETHMTKAYLATSRQEAKEAKRQLATAKADLAGYRGGSY